MLAAEAEKPAISEIMEVAAEGSGTPVAAEETVAPVQQVEQPVAEADNER